MLARNHGFAAHELRIIHEHREAILEAWYEHCGRQ
jgi:hypothetical protein